MSICSTVTTFAHKSTLVSHTLEDTKTVKCERCRTLNSCITASLYELIKPFAMFRTAWIRPSAAYINNGGFIIQFRRIRYAFRRELSREIMIFRSGTVDIFIRISCREIWEFRDVYNYSINDDIAFLSEVFIMACFQKYLILLFYTF